MAEVRHIEFDDFNVFRVWAAGFDPLELLKVSCRDDDACSEPVELVGEVLADSRGPSRDPDSLAAVVGFGVFSAYVCHEGVEDEDPGYQLKHRYYYYDVESIF